MSDIKNLSAEKRNLLKNEFFSQERLNVPGTFSSKGSTFYKLAETGQIIWEIELDLGFGKPVADIAAIADIHLNCFNAADESDEELMLTKKCRMYWNDGVTIPAADKCMDVADYLDQTVILGDTLDCLSNGAIEATKNHVFARDKNLLCVLGNHDYTKHVQTGLTDTIPTPIRQAVLAEFWPHDIHYCVTDVGEKIILFGADNGVIHYRPEVIKPLKETIERAKAEDKKIIIFQHVPVCSGLEKYKELKSVWPQEKSRIVHNFCDPDWATWYPETTNEVDAEIKELITSNADVVKCILSGHCHSAYHTEIPAYYTDENGRHDTFIQQYVLPSVAEGNNFVGIVTRLIVK